MATPKKSTKKITPSTVKKTGKIIQEMSAKEKKDAAAVANKFFNPGTTPKKIVKKPVGATVTSLAEAEAKAKQPKPAPKPAPEEDLVKKISKRDSAKRAEKREAKAKTNPAPKKGAKAKKSITQAIYELFVEKGVDNVKPEEATAVALAVKPGSKFDKWHLYFHRRNFKALVEVGENPLDKWS